MSDQQRHTLGILARQWTHLAGGGWRLVIFTDTGEVGRLTILVDPATGTPMICTDEIAEQLLHLVPADDINRRLTGSRP